MPSGGMGVPPGVNRVWRYACTLRYVPDHSSGFVAPIYELHLLSRVVRFVLFLPAERESGECHIVCVLSSNPFQAQR